MGSVQQADLRIASNAVGEKYKCLAFTLEMPFKDVKDRPDPVQVRVPRPELDPDPDSDPDRDSWCQSLTTSTTCRASGAWMRRFVDAAPEPSKTRTNSFSSEGEAGWNSDATLPQGWRESSKSGFICLRQGWSLERAKALGASILQPISESLPNLR